MSRAAVHVASSVASHSCADWNIIQQSEEKNFDLLNTRPDAFGSVSPENYPVQMITKLAYGQTAQKPSDGNKAISALIKAQ